MKKHNAPVNQSTVGAGVREGVAETMLTGSTNPLLAPIDQIKLAYDSIVRDRDRLRDAINTIRVNAIRSTETEKLIDFLRTDFGAVTTGLTIGEAVTAWTERQHSMESPQNETPPSPTHPIGD